MPEIRGLIMGPCANRRRNHNGALEVGGLTCESSLPSAQHRSADGTAHNYEVTPSPVIDCDQHLSTVATCQGCLGPRILLVRCRPRSGPPDPRLFAEQPSVCTSQMRRTEVDARRVVINAPNHRLTCITRRICHAHRIVVSLERCRSTSCNAGTAIRITSGLDPACPLRAGLRQVRSEAETRSNRQGAVPLPRGSAACEPGS